MTGTILTSDLQGTTSDPKFVPDIGRVAGNVATGAVQKVVSGKTGAAWRLAQE